MKKNLFTFLLALFPLFAFADAVEIDGIYYNLISKAKIAEVTSKPDTYSGDVVIPATVVYEETEYNVTTIVDRAFYDCTGLTTISIGNNVTHIGYAAFSGCSNLTYVNIPNSLLTIGSYAFSGCTKMESIVLPEGLETIQANAFMYCTNLQSINIPSSVTAIEEFAFEYSGVTKYNIASLESWLNIDFQVDEIERHLFINNEEIIDVTIPTSIKKVKRYVFANCTGLKTIQFHDGVTWIDNHAFSGCTGLKSIDLPESVTTINYSAFSNCSSLETINIPNGITTLYSTTFSNCTSLKEIIIPDGVIDLAFGVFYGCSSLTSISIPNSVTTIGDLSFDYCTSLRTIIIGSGVQSIKKDNTFANCSALTDVFCFAENVPTTKSNAFENSYVDYAKLHVLAASVSSYSASAPWSGFGTKVAITSEDITIGDLGIGTFCGSNPIDLSGTEDVKAYVVSSYEKATGQVTLTRTYYVPPFTGVVVKGNKGVYTIPAGVGEPVYPNMMKGVTTDTNLNKVNGDYTNYVLANKGGNLGFYAVSDGSTLSAGKAYLPLPTADLPTAARGLTLNFDDGETTEIMKVASQEKAPQGYYDLQGRRVANPTSGLYIVNGKKVIIK